MSSRDFCFWLQGHLEISKSKTLSPVAVKEIRRHLALVFQRVKPTKQTRRVREREVYCAPRDPNRKICTSDTQPYLRKLVEFEKRSRKSRFLAK